MSPAATLAASALAHAAALALGALALARAGRGRASLALEAATAYLVGLLALALILFLGSCTAPGRVGAAWVLVPGALAAATLAWARLRARPARPTGDSLDRVSVDRVSVPVLLVLGALALGDLGAALSSGLGFDGNWVFGIKARAAFLERGFPLSYLGDASRRFSHPEYPLLVPLAEAALAFVTGQTGPLAAKPLFALVHAALLAVAYAGLSRELPRLLALAFTVVLATLPGLARWAPTGYADVLLATFWLASAVWLERWARGGSRRDLVLALLAAAGAAWTKREGGLAFALQALFAVVLAPRRERAHALALALGTFALVLGPWVLVEKLLAPGAKDFVPVTLTSTLEGLPRVPLLARLAAEELASLDRWGVLWLLALVALALALVRGARREERGLRLFRIASVLVPLLAFSFCYVWSRLPDVSAHVATSLDRTVAQVAPRAVLLVGLELGPALAPLALALEARLGVTPPPRPRAPGTPAGP